MATISLAENEHGGYYPSTALATHTFTIAPKNVVLSAQNTNLSGSDISLTVQVKYNTNAGGRNYIDDIIQISCAVDRPDGTKFTVANFRCRKDSSLSANTNSAMTIGAQSIGSISIGGLFNSSNPTVKTIPLTWTASRYSNAMTLVTAKTTSSGYDPVGYRDGAWTPIVVTDGYVTLDAPPTFDTSALSIDTSSAYAGATTASVTVSNLSAKYGGSITEAKLTIGNQTATRTDNGTLSIALGAVGTFTPTVTVTDSRGQVTTQTLEAITVGDYTSPSVSIAVQRTLATGVPNDEGEYGTISATFEFVDAIAQLAQPTVTVDGTPATVTWYSTRATDGTLSGTVNWASLTSPVTVFGIVDAPNIQTSYQLAVTPIDSISSGTTITQTLASAFYTIDFLAGGHGIAFGQPASQDGFECNMPTTFHDTVDCEDTLTASDMTTQEVADFVDSLDVSGSGVAVDLVIEEGTEGIWTYRKWSSGIAECWGQTYVPTTTYSANGGYKIVQETLPNGLFVTAPEVVNASGRINGLIHTTMGYTSPDTNNSIQTYLINRHSTTAVTQWGAVFWNVKGRWKE